MTKNEIEFAINFAFAYDIRQRFTEIKEQEET